MFNVKITATLIASHFKLSTSDSPSIDEEKKKMKKVHYANIVGSLMHLMTCKD